MANETVITVVGNLTAAPDLRFTASGAAVANFTIASTPRTFNKQSNSWEDGETLFLRCSAWRQLAENVAESLEKGTRVIVQGRLKQRSYEKDGEKRVSYELDVDEIGPSLTWATARVTRASRDSNTRAATPGQQQATRGRQAPAEDPWATPGGPAGGWGGNSGSEPPF